MPKVTINEIDQSRYVVNSQRAPLIALTPIISSWGSTENAVLIQSETDFKNYFGTPLENAIEGDITRSYALNLINSGVSLLAKRIKPTCSFEDGKKPAEPIIDSLYADMDKGIDPITEQIQGYADVNEITSDTVTKVYVRYKNGEGDGRVYYCVDPNTGAEIELPMHHEALADDNGALRVVPNDYVGGYDIVESTVEGALEVVAKVTLADVTEVAPALEVQVGDFVKIENNTFVVATEGETGALVIVDTMPEGEISVYTVNKDTLTPDIAVGQYVKYEAFDPTKDIEVKDVDLGGVVPEINTYVVTYDTYITNGINANPPLFGTYETEINRGYNMNLTAKAKYFGSYGNKIAIRFTKSNTNSDDVLAREPKKTVTITTYIITKRTDAPEITDNLISADNIKSLKAVDSVTLRYDDLKLEDSINKLNDYLDEFTLISDIDIRNSLGQPISTLEEYERFIDSVDFATGSFAGQYFILMNGNDYFTEITDNEGEVIIAPTTEPLEQFYKSLEEEPTGSTDSDLSSINEFWNDFKDPYIYDFDFICASGFANRFDEARYNTDPDAEIGDSTNRKLHANMLKLAAYRGDAVACLDCPKQYNHNDLIKYFSALSNSDSVYSYGTTHGPWCKIRDITNGNYLLVPGSFIFLATIGTNLARNSETQIWYAPAGVARASTNLVESPQYEIGATILDEWQNNVDNIAVRINPIMKILNYGYVIYGNATLMQDEEGYSKSALQSLGTRVLCNVVKKAIFSICVALTFEPNDYILWAEFKTRLSTTLDQMKINGGISDYQIVMDETTVTDEAMNNLTVPGKVFISPTRPAEFFDIDFTITQAGVTFDESKSDVIG